jgi:hypothetical protein
MGGKSETQGTVTSCFMFSGCCDLSMETVDYEKNLANIPNSLLVGNLSKVQGAPSSVLVKKNNIKSRVFEGKIQTEVEHICIYRLLQVKSTHGHPLFLPCFLETSYC